MTQYYFLKNKKLVPCKDVFEWSRRFTKESERVIEQTNIREYLISTVFLGLDHGIDNDHPELFETIAFGKDREEKYMLRTSSYDEAKKAHQLVCQLAQKRFIFSGVRPSIYRRDVSPPLI